MKESTNLNPEINEHWGVLGRVKALKVINRSPDSKESESIYVVHGSKTFAIRAERNAPSYSTYQRMLSTFRFTVVK